MIFTWLRRLANTEARERIRELEIRETDLLKRIDDLIVELEVRKTMLERANVVLAELPVNTVGQLADAVGVPSRQVTEAFGTSPAGQPSSFQRFK